MISLFARILFASLAIADLLAATPRFLITNQESAAGGGRSVSSRFEIVSSINQTAASDLRQSISFTERRGYIGRLNEAPLLLQDQFLVRPGRSLKILKADLFANDSDADDTHFQIITFSPTSSRGAAISTLGDWVIYNTALNEDDTFTYTVGDGIDESTGVIILSNQPFSGVTFNIALVREGADNLLKVFGIPGRTYQIQTTPSLTEPILWTDLGSPAAAPAHGLIQRRDVAPPATRFYRAIEL
ncbi:MAG: Ig-like domain-containing protein [Verrucomicrobiota bacterium]|nr:Ig-like domain-containing protein [Verrucomicrobiota bacterium]